jgi:hypothetical protein
MGLAMADVGSESEGERLDFDGELVDGDVPSFRVPSLRGRHVFLRPVTPDDYRFLRAAELGGELAIRWRLRGASASPEQWAQNLWQSVLTQYLVVGSREPTPLGLVAVYQPNHRDGYAFLAAERFGPPRPVPAMMFGVALFIEHVFRCWDFHKLYLEVPEYNVSQLASGVGRLFALEGRLREHLWYDGRRWDQIVLALYRETWARESRRLLAAAVGPGDVVVRVPLPAEEGGRPER